MRKKILWVAAVLALIATPAVIGLVALRDDGNPSAARRAAALIASGPTGGAGYQLTFPGVAWLPSGKAIEVQSFSWGVSNAGGTQYSGTTAGKAQFNDLKIVKQIDQTSPQLAMHVANGKHLSTAVLTLYKNTGAGPVKYATYTLSNVLVGGVQHSGGSPENPSEEISLNYGTIEADVSSIDSKGMATSPSHFGWDLSSYTAQ